MTVQGPVKKPQPDGMSHRGGGGVPQRLVGCRQGHAVSSTVCVQGGGPPHLSDIVCRTSKAAQEDDCAPVVSGRYGAEQARREPRGWLGPTDVPGGLWRAMSKGGVLGGP